MASNSAAASQSGVLCRYYENGACIKGETCSFSHDRSNKPDNVCRYYLKGQCSYDKACRFDHVKPANRDTNYSGHSSKKVVTNFIGDERPPKLVSLNKPKPSLNQTKNWVDAPDFVPGRKSHLSLSSCDCGLANRGPANTTTEDNVLYSEAIKSGVEYMCDDLTDEEAATILCPFVAMGTCKNDKCPYFHGLKCSMCDHHCLDPNDPAQQKEHEQECMKWLEEDMEYAFAVQKSNEVSCGICLDKIRLNPDSKDKRFGILPECNHPFCLTCIRKWRSSSTKKDKFVRACPLCRISSGFVIPSEVWIDDSDEKSKLIKQYKEALSSKACKYFDVGKGTCPFGSNCFYKHAMPDGTIVKVQARRYNDSDGESRIINPVSLWQFIEERDLVDLDDLLERLDDILP